MLDGYDEYMEAGSAGELGRRRGLEQVGFWRKILAHPTYDAFWQDQAVDRILAERPLAVPAEGNAPFVEYVSDPAKPVPFRARPIEPVGYEDEGLSWPEWLVDDQREASGRPDVLVFVSEPFSEPLKVAGRSMVNLVALTSGSDADWVVKLIDVHPPEVAGQPEMGGYQLMVAADIFRGRYRSSFEHPAPIAPGEPLAYRFALPTANHVFLPGHRLMVQVQSSWFPLYDRNPQTFVPSIFWAKLEDYQRATQRVWHAPGQESFIELPLVVTTN